MSPGDSFVPHKMSVLASVDTSWPMEPTLGETMMANCNVASVYANQKTRTSTGVMAPQLAKRWCIPVHRAQQMICVTAQQGIRTHPDDLRRRLLTNYHMLWYNNCMYTETMKADVVSMRMNKYAHQSLHRTRRMDEGGWHEDQG
jgi:hypothetical protein